MVSPTEEEEEEVVAAAVWGVTFRGSVDVAAHGQVDEDEDVELDEDGEAQEDGVHEQADQAQPLVQSPLVQVDAQDSEEY